MSSLDWSNANGRTGYFAEKLAIEIAWFKPFVIEALVTKIVQEFDLNPENIIWVQAYSANYQESNSTGFSQVTFCWQNGKATNTRWSAIALDLIQELINQDSEPKPQYLSFVSLSRGVAKVIPQIDQKTRAIKAIHQAN